MVRDAPSPPAHQTPAGVQMSDVRFTHTDNDGDKLEVTAGMLGSIIWVWPENEEAVAGVAVRYEQLPALIAVLQGILAESDHGATL